MPFFNIANFIRYIESPSTKVHSALHSNSLLSKVIAERVGRPPTSLQRSLRMSVDVGDTDPQSEIIRMGGNLCQVGQSIRELLLENPTAIQDSNCLQVFADVTLAIGALFKESDGGKKLVEDLRPLAAYTSLMPYFLLIKSIVDRTQQIMKIGRVEHKERLEWINGELLRIAAQATGVAKRLEDLGKSLIDIIKADEAEKRANLIVFHLHYSQISSSLVGCISDMQSVKRKIDEGFQSVKEFRKGIKYAIFGVGILASAAMIIAPLAVGLTGLIASYGAFDIIGVGAVAGVAVGSIAVYPTWRKVKEVNEIEERYNDQTYNWQTLDKELQIMKKNLEIFDNTCQAV